MLSRLLSRLRPSTAPQEALPPPLPDRPVWLIGDIHGRADLLDRLLRRLDKEADWVFLGDYVDRGPDSAGVLRHLREVTSAAPDRVTCLIGNHERMFLDFLGGDPQAARTWLRNGGVQTLASFGISATEFESDEDGADALHRAALERIPPDLVTWLHLRPRLWRSGDVIGVHAGLDPARPPEDQDEETLLWSRPSAMETPRADALWVVHGHTVTRPAEIVGRRIAIDTGAWFSEVLTAVLLRPGEAPRFVDTG